MLGRLLVAGLHVEKGEVGVNKLLVGLKLLSLVPLGDGAREIALPVMAHGHGKLRVEVIGMHREHLLELGERLVVGPRRVVEHRVVVLILHFHEGAGYRRRSGMGSNGCVTMQAEGGADPANERNRAGRPPFDRPISQLRAGVVCPLHFGPGRYIAARVRAHCPD